MKFRERDKY